MTLDLPDRDAKFGGNLVIVEVAIPVPFEHGAAIVRMLPIGRRDAAAVPGWRSRPRLQALAC